MANRVFILQLPSNRSATYLPVVAREHKHWSIEEYMTHLTTKAGGEKMNGEKEKYGYTKAKVIRGTQKNKRLQWNNLVIHSTIIFINIYLEEYLM